jgi:cytochrome c oxidase subunit 4
MNARTVSSKTLWATWAALIVLLGATWLASRFNLGLGNTIIALVISGTKMMLVILFFMQVRYSSRLIWIFACAGFIWWMIFISLAMTDYFTRQPVIPYNNAPVPSQPQKAQS